MNKLIVGVNDFATIHPELLDEWDYEKNNKLGIFPDKITWGSSKCVWWKCRNCGHSWKAIISNRSRGGKCQVCSSAFLIRSIDKFKDLLSFKPELLKEWDFDKNGNLNPKFLTFHSHKKVWWKCSKGHSWKAFISSRSDGVGCPICSNHKVLVGYNDFQTKYPEIAKEWNYEKNINLLPTDIVYGTSKIVWWKCSKGHEWKCRVNHRVEGEKCPICSNKIVLAGYNDLKTLRPDLAKEWNYEKNGDLLPSQVTPGSVRKVWWKCSKGHEWQVSLSNRNKGATCPYCANKKILVGYNDLASLYPNLIKEWDYIKNGDLSPFQVFPGSAKSVWWKCKYGHSWKCRISHRVEGSGCPICNFSRGSSFPEQIVFYFLKKYFEKQHDVLNRFKFNNVDLSFELDIFIPTMALAIEYNGEYWHSLTKCSKIDLKKKDCLKKLGIRLICICESSKNRIVEDNIFFNRHKNCLLNLSWAINSLFSLIGFNYNISEVDIENNRIKILSYFYNIELKNSFAKLYPELVMDWDYDKNKSLKPENFKPRSSIKIWWKCHLCGHKWQTTLCNRVKSPFTCPKCRNLKVIK